MASVARGNATSNGMAKTSEPTLMHKTMLCSFHAKGMCTRGAQCTFAHGSAALKVKPDLSKTKMCPNLRHGGHCTDVFCQFAHAKSELRSVHQARAAQAMPQTMPVPNFQMVQSQPRLVGPQSNAPQFATTTTYVETPLDQIPSPAFLTRASAMQGLTSAENNALKTYCGSEVSTQICSTEDLGESSFEDEEWSDGVSLPSAPAAPWSPSSLGPELPLGPDPLWWHTRSLEVPRSRASISSLGDSSSSSFSLFSAFPF